MTKSEFETAVREHQGMVYSIAVRFFHNPPIAEEVAQDVFLRLYEGHRNVNVGAHCISWLRRCTVHRCIDTARRSSYRNEIQMDTLPDVPVGAPETDPLLQEHLRRMIAALPEKSRAVLVLRFGEDMEVEEIGRILQMPVPTVWSHLQRGTAIVREKLMRCMKEKENEPVRTRSS